MAAGSVSRSFGLLCLLLGGAPGRRPSCWCACCVGSLPALQRGLGRGAASARWPLWLASGPLRLVCLARPPGASGLLAAPAARA
eukprot:15461497-Alexandrium_andersonii.AAC.1